MSLVSDERVGELLEKEAKLEAEVDRLRAALWHVREDMAHLVQQIDQTLCWRKIPSPLIGKKRNDRS